jgi:hypothetical protein
MRHVLLNHTPIHVLQVVFWVACVISARSIVGLVVVTFAPAFDFVTSNLDIYFR